MKVFLFICLAFVAVQVSSAPTENIPTIFVLSSDGLKELTSSPAEVLKLFPTMTTEDKSAETVQTEEKKIEQPEANVVEPATNAVPSQENGIEQPTIKVVNEPAIKMEEIKQVEKVAEKPAQKTEKTLTENTNENSKKGETSTEASNEVKSNKNDEVEKTDDQKISEQSSLLNQIFDSMFGENHLKQKPATLSSPVLEISIEHTSIQPEFTEIAPEDDVNNDDNDMEISLTPVDVYQPRREETRQLSMLEQFLRMLNSINSIPSIFGYNTPTRSSRILSPKPTIFDVNEPSYYQEPRPRILFA